jgi:lysophospholipase L1-like esterase
MRLKKFVVNIAVLTIAATLTLGLCELMARSVLNASDYLTVEMVPDSMLGAVPSAGALRSTFDAWGFRNRAVPDHADMVAIGDSHTFGNTATMDDAWPQVLGRLTGQSVYNMGLGGYGPNQYFELLRTRALGLKPRTVIIGLYMGDDFENAFLITYGLAHWSYLRELPAEKVNSDIWQAPAALSWHRRIRVWLSAHSVTYQLVVHGPLFGRILGDANIRKARSSDSATSLTIPEQHILEAFRPRGLLKGLDQNSPSVREGMRITFKLVSEMHEICRSNGIQFVVVVIPTKETVFADYFERDSTLPLSDVVAQLIANERVARDKTLKLFTDSGISYVDALPSLKQSRERELYARAATDMHPGRNGYRVIAEAVAAFLQQRPGNKVIGND